MSFLFFTLQPSLHPRVRAEGEDQQGADRPVGLPQVRLPAQGGQALLLLQEQRPPEPEVRQDANLLVKGCVNTAHNL